MSSINPNPKRTWTAEEKVRIVLESLTTNISVAELCRKYAINPNVFYRWKQRFIDGGKAALSSSNKFGNNREATTKDAEIERLKKLIGELTIANDSMKKVLEGEGKKW